ncbi:hypothetical protein [Maricaulis sp.]|uniref:hypothetical protein n=1 Tax=Maricaulis sp. TaxID=1486257 RepID=UPI003A900D2E
MSAEIMSPSVLMDTEAMLGTLANASAGMGLTRISACAADAIPKPMASEIIVRFNMTAILLLSRYQIGAVAASGIH